MEASDVDGDGDEDLVYCTQYGFGGVDFPAPQATLMKTVIDGVLNANLPWGLVLTGAAFALVAELLGVPSLAFAVGIYLPLELSVPIFAGGLIAAAAERWNARVADPAVRERNARLGMLTAAGLITGEALVGIFLAIPIVLSGDAGVLALADEPFGGTPGLVVVAALGWWVYRSASRPMLLRLALTRLRLLLGLLKKQTYTRGRYP